jgi:hypothetical protein
MSKELILNASQFGIKEDKAAQIEHVFVPMVAMLKEFEIAYDKVIEESGKGITKEVIEAAKKVRLQISKIRIDAEKIRKAEKEEFLRAGKAIDGVANILKFAVVEKEEKLKEIEKYFENLAKEKWEKVNLKRKNELLKYDPDPADDLADMSNDVWEHYLNGVKLDYEKRIEAEKKAEEERIEREKAEEQRRVEIEEENKRLKAEAEAAEKKAEVERIKREKKEKERDEEIAKQEAILKKERDERERIEKELAAKKAEEERIKAEQAAKEKSLALAPDKVKLLQLATDISNIKLPVVKNEEAEKILIQVRERLARTYKDIIGQSEKL